jgi:hypothetical protein
MTANFLSLNIGTTLAAFIHEDTGAENAMTFWDRGQIDIEQHE